MFRPMRAQFHPFRLLLVVALMFAWVAATNHCVWATPAAKAAVSVQQQEEMPADCPMHTAQGSKPRPADSSGGCDDLPCCNKFQAPSLSAA